MNRDEKAAVVDQVATQIQESEAIFAVDYRGISVQQVAELREKLNEADATLRVVKNTLTELAADKAGAESLKELLEGPTAFTFVKGDAALAAKAIATFRREHEVPRLQGRHDGRRRRLRSRRSRRSPSCPRATCSTASSWASWPRRSPAWCAASTS